MMSPRADSTTSHVPFFRAAGGGMRQAAQKFAAGQKLQGPKSLLENSIFWESHGPPEVVP
jgi:hypothetical protein